MVFDMFCQELGLSHLVLVSKVPGHIYHGKFIDLKLKRNKVNRQINFNEFKDIF
jgi:hypothetical protein